MSNSSVSFLPARFASGFFFLFAFVAADPPSEGIGGAPRDVQPCRCRAVTRDATLARHGPSRATGRYASRRSAVALSAQVPPPSPLPGPARRLHATRHSRLAAVPGFSCPRLPAAVDATSRSAFRIASRKRPSRAGCSRFTPKPERSQHYIHYVFVISFRAYIRPRLEV